jgi:phosphatidylserine synthase
LLFVTLFQKRHPASAPGAVRVFVFFAIIVFLNFLALSRIPTPAYENSSLLYTIFLIFN